MLLPLGLLNSGWAWLPRPGGGLAPRAPLEGVSRRSEAWAARGAGGRALTGWGGEGAGGAGGGAGTAVPATR